MEANITGASLNGSSGLIQTSGNLSVSERRIWRGTPVKKMSVKQLLWGANYNVPANSSLLLHREVLQD